MGLDDEDRDRKRTTQKKPRWLFFASVQLRRPRVVCSGDPVNSLKKKKKESEKAAGYMLLFGPQAGGRLGGGSSRNPDCAEEL